MLNPSPSVPCHIHMSLVPFLVTIQWLIQLNANLAGLGLSYTAEMKRVVSSRLGPRGAANVTPEPIQHLCQMMGEEQHRPGVPPSLSWCQH